ncbi:Hypothetical predicted protein [Mytilus galloprovincialis]|uniref:DUF1758 domain-containing protein n=1 Tax=Mytilus galloprovincialis TaxID=29158 RepID=A0A8B6EHR0_MYTGA|nr:Hypothetical predicted protein [Mytilus galloprovincialis]
MPVIIQRDYNRLKRKMEERFGHTAMKERYVTEAKLRKRKPEESLRDFGQAIEDLYRRAYPGNPEIVEENSIKAFLDKCGQSKDFRLAVKRTRPNTLQEAVNNSMQEECLRVGEKDLAVGKYAKINILLKTAIAPVVYNDQEVECNILFDEGAQRSFITQKLANQLEIKPTENVSIQLSAFGDLSQKVCNLDTETIQLQTDTGEKVRINTLIVPEIAVPIKNNISLTTRSLPHLRELKLAHSVQSTERFEIDLLIGADHYWDIIEDKVIKGKGPTAVQ